MKIDVLLKKLTQHGLLWVLAFNGLMALFLLCPGVPSTRRVLVDDIMQAVGPCLVGLFCLVKSMQDRFFSSGERRAAICLSLGATCYGSGMALWTYSEIILRHDNPFPSAADLFFLSAYPFLMAGIFFLPGRPLTRAARAIVGLDSLMLLIGLVTFSWYYVLGPTLLQGSETLLGKVLGAAYPLADLALLGCLLMLTSRGGGRPDVAQKVGGGLACIIIIDTVFAYRNLHATYHSGGPLDVLWPLGYMLLALSGRTLRIAAKPLTETALLETPFVRAVPLWRVPLPYLPIPALAALIIGMIRTHGDEAFEPGVYAGSMLLVLLVLARQWLALLENRRLSAHLTEFNVQLEDTVAARTAALSARTEQLTALLELTAAVHDASDEAQVLAVARAHTRAALEADTVLLWLTDGDGSPVSLHSVDGVAVETDACAENSDLCLRAPLLERGTILGTIGVVRSTGSFGSTEDALLRSIGAEVGRALGNARRLREARDAADRDPVTSLFNHRAIHQLLDRELMAAHVADRPMSLMMIDLDNFKLFNDTYGHPVGDEVLRRIASAVRAECGECDHAARYGGDEFLLVLPGQDGAQARALALRLQERVARQTLQSEEISTGETRIIPVALSCGVAAFPADSYDRHELLSIADANLYAAKNSEESVIESSDAQRVNRGLRADGAFGLLDAMLTAVDNKDRYTRRHSEDVTDYALWIAEEIGLPEALCQSLRQGGLLHDVGKIGVPEDILRKPGRLTPEEYAILQRHAELGALIVAGVPGMEDVLPAVRHHHERWDGNGYPDKLAGDAIPLAGRILAVADAVSAMTTDRPYRRGMAWETALDIVREGSGTQFDPTMADAFLRAAARQHKPTLPAQEALLRAA